MEDHDARLHAYRGIHPPMPPLPTAYLPTHIFPPNCQHIHGLQYSPHIIVLPGLCSGILRHRPTCPVLPSSRSPSLVRHPAYTGAYLWIIGLQFSQFGKGSWWWECKVWMTGFGLCFGLFFVILCLLVSGTLWTRIKKEDEVLRNVFKDQWVAWSLRTPYVILPYVY